MSTRYLGGIIRKTPLALDPALGNAANGVFTMNQYMQAVKDGTWPGFDQYFNQTVLSLHGNGTNGDQNNTFLDSSTNNFTITRNGNTTQGTFSPFSLAAGEWSNYFDGSNDALAVAGSTDFQFGTGDFCVEAFVYFNAVGTQQGIAGTYDGGNGGWWFYVDTGPALAFRNGDAGVVTRSYSFAVGTWYHVAVSRSSSTLRFFVNGTQVGADENSYTQNITRNNSNGCAIGRYVLSSGSNGSYVNGYISNLRVVKGSAVYTGSYTTPTAPLTAITNTQLLTCQSNRFVDTNTQVAAKTITLVDAPRVTPFSPFAPTAAYSAGTNGGSGYFDNNGDFLTGTSNSAYNFSGDFTIEAWVYYDKSSGNNTIIDTRSSDALAAYVFGIVNAKLDFLFRSSGTTRITSSASVPLQSWNHVAVSRSGSTIRLFINGVQDGSVVDSATITAQSFPSIGGGRAGGTDTVTGYYFSGYIGGLRILNGTGYSTMTVPTAPLTAITNTSLLLNFTNAGIIDNTGKNNLETVGNAQIDTTTKKFGTGSLEFDGTGDWLLMPNNLDQQLGTGNFTIEFWVYLASGDTGSARGLVAKGGASTGWLVSLDSSQKVVFTYTTSTITSSGAITTNAWNHIAVVRSGTGSNQTKIYIGGTNDGTGTVSTDFNQTESMYVGANRTGGDPMKGFIDDLRITKGVARYTTNFTPQTSQWQDQ